MINLLIGIGIAAVALAGKNKVEDVVTVESDSFHRWDPLFKKYGTQFDVDWRILKAISMNESRLGEEESVKRGLASPTDVEGSKSSDGKSWGLMQMTLTTGHDFDPSITVEKLNDPEYSIRIAAKFLAWIEDHFDDADPRRLEAVVKSYNQGVGNTLKELDGRSDGFAGEYWDRFQRNFALVSQGE